MSLADLPPVRRVVTGFDAEGKAVVVSDGQLEISNPFGAKDSYFIPVWGITATPTIAPASQDGLSALGKTMVNKNGVTFRIVDRGPHSSSRFHRTLSVDFVQVLTGEIELELDDSKRVTLKEGDVVVQQATVHAWHNTTDKPARFTAIMLDADVRAGPTSMDLVVP